ncbi:hypothetical protein Asp14428_73320 [Actinoplanes sp. NBRC 14428]|nr:hypothetical protein Asp14428_73320 [Actinoplanes sp. NBRC 14428]
MHRGEALLWELMPDEPGFRHAELVHDAGWQVTRVGVSSGDLPDTFLTDLRDLTGAPVLAADILDSDAAYVHAVGIDTPFWDTWLEPDGAISHFVLAAAPFDDDDNYLGDDWVDPEWEGRAAEAKRKLLEETLTGAAAASAATAWAVEAGLTPDPIAAVVATLADVRTFAEEQFFALLDRLGIRVSEQPAPPTVADVLRLLLGLRLTKITKIPHLPVRGEHLELTDAPDLVWAMEGHPPVIACSCRGEFELRIAEPPAGGSAYEPAGAVEGRELTDACLITHRVYPDIHGAVLRFGDRDLAVSTVDGRWVSHAEGSDRRVLGWLAPQKRVSG